MRTVAALLCALLLLAAGVGGCAAREEERAEQVAAAVWIDAARRAHMEADAALARGDRQAARAVLRGAWDRATPSDVSSEDARVVKQDLAFRLAEIDLEAGQAADARQWADRGLELGRGRDLFTGNLLVARGRAKEALGEEREAAADYFEALEINDDLLRRTLGEGER